MSIQGENKSKQMNVGRGEGGCSSDRPENVIFVLSRLLHDTQVTNPTLCLRYYQVMLEDLKSLMDKGGNVALVGVLDKFVGEIDRIQERTTR